MADDRGDPIAYLAVPTGVPVQTSDGREVGTLKRVLADEGADIFDGIVVDTHDGDRFVDAPDVGELYERLVVLRVSGADLDRLSEPSPGPAAVDVGPADLGDESTGDKIRDAARRTWDRLSGNY